MPEHQTIEWKETWHDEYLEWICGYANAYGGTLYIGKNNDGDVVGVSDKDSRKLLEVIPNKITDTMGIVADVNLLYKDGLQYIEIIVEKYPSLISYHGKYFYRSGSTMRTIVFFMSGMIEAWGRGFDKIKEACARYDGPLPEYNISKSGVMVLCKACDKYLKLLSGGERENDSADKIKNETSFETSLKQVLKPKDYKKLEPIIEKLAAQETISIQEVMELTKKSRTTAWRYMQILIDCNAVEISGNTNNVSYKRLK